MNEGDMYDRHFYNSEETADYMRGLVDNYLDSMDTKEIAEVIKDCAARLSDLYVINIDQEADCFEVQAVIETNSLYLAGLWKILKNKEVGIFGLFKLQMENSLLNHAEEAVNNDLGV